MSEIFENEIASQRQFLSQLEENKKKFVRGKLCTWKTESIISGRCVYDVGEIVYTNNHFFTARVLGVDSISHVSFSYVDTVINPTYVFEYRGKKREPYTLDIPIGEKDSSIKNFDRAFK